jgi:hypothetical protein
MAMNIAFLYEMEGRNLVYRSDVSEESPAFIIRIEIVP